MDLVEHTFFFQDKSDGCFAQKTSVPRNGPNKTMKSDDSSLNRSFVGAVFSPRKVFHAKQMLALDSES